jgi:small Trp-rich protein
MIGFLIGALFFFGRIFEVEPFVNWPWWVIAAPIVLTVFWYEVIEKKFDLRTKREQKEQAERHRERILRLQGHDPKKRK